MKIQLKKEVDKEVSKLLEGLRDLGLTVEMPDLQCYSTGVHYLGRQLPKITNDLYIEFKIRVPDDKIECDIGSEK